MSWFGSSKKENVRKSGSELGKLPELPKLPEVPRMEIENPSSMKDSPSQLPSYPSNSFGEKFSQNAIKDAVKGGKGDEEDVEGYGEDEFSEEEEMPKVPKKVRDIHEPVHQNTGSLQPDSSQGSVFVRLDKFEEALNKFNKAKQKVMEVEHLVSELKRTNEKEMQELTTWEKEVQAMKKNFEKIGQDIFSKI